MKFHSETIYIIYDERRTGIAKIIGVIFNFFVSNALIKII
jgi:hypothetical protein